MPYSPQPAPSGQQSHPFALHLFELRPLTPPSTAQSPVKVHSRLKIVVGAGCALLVFGLGVTVDGGGKKAADVPLCYETAGCKQGTKAG
ncbi:hypothetical protein OHU45_31640 [Streptomyces tubercidicus]|uniref:hypothetical protein n=1 Tax=Streptomyces tubercidicus TaxID=47759 RepID=UPI002E127DEA|nr:hypothetical protein OG761_31645 [Streptomyces tubercidicus]